MAGKGFKFFDPGVLFDDELSLVLLDTHPGDEALGYVPAYRFEMRIPGEADPVGNIQLRVATTDRIELYRGHIGYNVAPAFRGRHYAARACQMLLPLARQHGLQPLWLTCNPDNVASRRTCERLGGQLVEIIDLAKDEEMYARGERMKCRYRVDL